MCNAGNIQMASSDMIPTVSVSIPLQTLTHAADTQPAGEAAVEHESGWLMKRETLDGSVPTHSPGWSDVGRSLLDTWVWSDTPLLSLTRVHGAKTHLLVSAGELSLNSPGTSLEVLHDSWISAKTASEAHRLSHLSCFVFFSCHSDVTGVARGAAVLHFEAAV